MQKDKEEECEALETTRHHCDNIKAKGALISAFSFDSIITVKYPHEDNLSFRRINDSFDVNSNQHVSIINGLGNGKNMSLHCQSKDNDLGQHNLADGTEFGWDFSANAWGTTLFYCDMEWEAVQLYHFDAYAFDRDHVRCQTQCLWLISAEGIHGLNGQTGFWEYIYQWPN
ncbi:hypothetical protein JRO89_XS03G0227200 [Xanthoceras sorbifolium]|uniref:S-protein homolog n=1 Tax=Xanthoceras sorbifolium TaxID=99658 RepID=A0ABQ8IB91_9ROSI|nr:hypothetical protein JRO89_XS03G0227200 [Xanthoceras sorbifolium]